MKHLFLAVAIAIVGHAHAETLGPEWIKVAKEGARTRWSRSGS